MLPQHTALVGVRNLDDREKDLVRNSGVHVFTMKDIDRLGVAAVATQALQAVTGGTAGIHVSFDLDVCDPVDRARASERLSREDSTTGKLTC